MLDLNVICRNVNIDIVFSEYVVYQPENHLDDWDGRVQTPARIKQGL